MTTNTIRHSTYDGLFRKSEKNVLKTVTIPFPPDEVTAERKIFLLLTLSRVRVHSIATIFADERLTYTHTRKRLHYLPFKDRPVEILYAEHYLHENVFLTSIHMFATPRTPSTCFQKRLVDNRIKRNESAFFYAKLSNNDRLIFSSDRRSIIETSDSN